MVVGRRMGYTFSAMTMKKLFFPLVTLVLAACCTQQQQQNQRLPQEMEITEPEKDKPGKITRPGKTQQPVKPVQVKPTKPFVPVAPGIKVSSVSVPGNYVAITFDDGPSSALTPKVLDVLKKYGAKATFFVLGDNAGRYPSVLARAVAEGHELGNHTYNHIKMTGNSHETVCSEIERTNAAIVAATGRRPKLMRPPYGATNSELVNLMYNNYGLRSIMWNVDTNDWKRPGVNVVVNRAVNSAKPGAIILLHDIHSSTAAAVEGIVKGLHAHGYQLVTVSELIEMGRAAAASAAQAPAAEVAAPTVDAAIGGSATIIGEAVAQ